MTPHAHTLALRTTKWSWPLVLVELIVAVNAVGGAVYGLAGAEDVPREWLDGTPFDTYTVPSLILLVAVGGSMIAAATALLFRHRRAPALSIVAGLILMGWIAVQVLMIAPNGGVSWLQPALFGAGGLVAQRVRRQRRLHDGARSRLRGPRSRAFPAALRT